MKCLAIGTAAVPLCGCAVGLGLIFAGLLRAEAYAPEMGSALFSRAMLGFALVETFMVMIVVFVVLVLIF
jgi:F0F1-type ATP synthase membrane subunit c/vacuolar-type H+-ATPase subunit K